MSTPTPFAGLDALAPGERLSTNGFKFQSIDPFVIDYLLRVGAVAHRHDAHPALANPTVAPTVATHPTGGSIPAAVTAYIAYTLLDSDGGESLAAPVVAASTPPGFVAPPLAPTVAVSYASGNLLSANYNYTVTVGDGAGGETMPSPATLVTVQPGHANAQAAISGLATLLQDSSGGAAGAVWRLWRAQDGGAWALVATGTGDTFVDSGVAGNPSVQPPRYGGTTRAANSLTVTVPSAGQPAGVAGFKLYVSMSNGLESPSLLSTHLPTDFDHAIVVPALTPTIGTPPAVSTCLPGAAKITSAEIVGGGGGGGGGGSTFPSVVAIASGPTNQPIPASATTTFTIPAPVTPEGSNFRLVVGLALTHPNPGQLSASITDSASDSATLFDAGSFAVGSGRIGNPAAAIAGDPDAFLYFSDAANAVIGLGVDQPVPQLSPTSAAWPGGGVVQPAQALANALSGGIQGDSIGPLTLSITESGGHAGTLGAVVVYYVSQAFDALLATPPPPAQTEEFTIAGDGATTSFTVGTDPFGIYAAHVSVYQTAAGTTSYPQGRRVPEGAYDLTRVAASGGVNTQIAFHVAPLAADRFVVHISP